jgi:hypothetical protein
MHGEMRDLDLSDVTISEALAGLPVGV